MRKCAGFRASNTTRQMSGNCLFLSPRYCISSIQNVIYPPKYWHFSCNRKTSNVCLATENVKIT